MSSLHNESPISSIPSAAPLENLTSDTQEIAILIPCFNEAMTIAKVITDFRQQLPSARIYVFDNASTDDSGAIARNHGAEVYYVKHRGKGNVVRDMFSLVDADIYIMVDGDDTYPAEAITALLVPILSKRADMVVGSRLMNEAISGFKRFNMFGNLAFRKMVNLIFRVRLTDILSGYRVMTRELIDEIPVLSKGFEIEIELTIRSLEMGYIIEEIPVNLRHRPEGSFSKIRVFRDGVVIFSNIVVLFRDYKPLTFFGSLGFVALLIGFGLGISVLEEFLHIGLVPRFPTAILAASLVLLGVLLILCGLILNAINHRFLELQYQLRRQNRKKLR